MNRQWQQWQEKIDALSLRERVILFAVLLATVVMLFQVVLIDPVMAERKRANQELNSVKQSLQMAENEKTILDAQLTAGVNRHKQVRKAQLEKQLAELDADIQKSVLALIPPRKMPEVLENVLKQNTELKLVSLENKPVVPLLEEDSSQPNGAIANRKAEDATTVSSKQGMYRHGFVLTLQGNYMAALRYFEQLSKLPWQFYWDDLRYQVETYPNARITLEVHTVSMSEDWIGV